jgi:hypothetical protein
VAGVDVDVNSNTSPAFIMTKGGYDKKLAIELAELFMDTKADVYVLYNDGSIYDEVNSYAKKKGLPGQMKYWDNHENHFHVRIDPSAYSKACGFTESAAGKIGDAWLSARGQDLD